MEIRNIAIIAHVDHGKTTLTDAMLNQTGMVEEGVSMDSDKIEKERGITIYAKNTSLIYKDTKINILDTPGHADFGSEVERVLRSVDSVLLVVDAQEGPMPQTKFVLKKSLELGLKPILVINKIDKPAADVERVHEDVFELFMDLGATDEQLDFETIYTIGRDGIAKKNMGDESDNLNPLLDLIIEKVEPANTDEASLKPLKAQVFNLAYDDFLGRLAICRVYEGSIKDKSNVFVKNTSGKKYTGKITRLFTFEGLNKKEVDKAEAGDIVMLAGIPEIYIGETILDDENIEPLEDITIDKPTLSVQITVNDSPFAGKSGKFLTSRQIRDRLEKELEINVGLKANLESMPYTISGRGELHLAILIENMRREGFELSVGQPEAIIEEREDGKYEPYEEVSIFVPEEYSGAVIEKLGKRRGVMSKMDTKDGQTSMVFSVPTRGLLGYRNEFVIDTKGEGILTSVFEDFKPYAGMIEKTDRGSMISMARGTALAFALANLQNRGTLYIGPTTEVYEGMVVGNTSKGEDMIVNPTKGKQLTNMRASGSDESIKLTPHMVLTLERAMDLMREDEYIEVTPEDIRLRKKLLTENERRKAKSKS